MDTLTPIFPAVLLTAGLVLNAVALKARARADQLSTFNSIWARLQDMHLTFAGHGKTRADYPKHYLDLFDSTFFSELELLAWLVRRDLVPADVVGEHLGSVILNWHDEYFVRHIPEDIRSNPLKYSEFKALVRTLNGGAAIMNGRKYIATPFLMAFVDSVVNLCVSIMVGAVAASDLDAWFFTGRIKKEMDLAPWAIPIEFLVLFVLTLAVCCWRRFRRNYDRKGYFRSVASVTLGTWIVGSLCLLFALPIGTLTTFMDRMIFVVCSLALGCFSTIAGIQILEFTHKELFTDTLAD